MKTSITNQKINRSIGILAIVILWQLFYLIIKSDILIPSPISVWKVFMGLLGDKYFYITILNTTFRVLISFTACTVLGILVGYFCGINKTFYQIFEPFIILIRSTPVISVIIIAIIWFQSSYVPIFTSFLMCFPVIWTNTVAGIRSTDKNLLEMSHIYNVSKINIFRDIYIRSSIPYLLSGLSTALGISWKAVAAAEVLALPKYSIGFNLYSSKIYLNSAELFAWTLIIILLSYFFEEAIKLFFREFSQEVKHD